MILPITLELSCLLCFLLIHLSIARPDFEKSTQPREVRVDNGVHGVYDAKAGGKTTWQREETNRYRVASLVSRVMIFLELAFLLLLSVFRSS